MSDTEAPTFQNETWEKYNALTICRYDFHGVMVKSPQRIISSIYISTNSQRKQPSLGKLDVFPIEIIQEIIPQIDLFTDST